MLSGALVPRWGTTAGVPGPRRSADECDAGWFAPVATRRRSMFGPSSQCSRPTCRSTFGPGRASGAALFRGAAALAGRIRLVLVRREDPVQRLAGVGQQLPGLRDLRIGPRADDLERGHAELADQAAHLEMRAARAAGHLVPRSPQLLLMRVGVGTALVGELIGATAAIGLLGPDQALILKLLKRRVDRARARPPDAAAALADLLDDLVAVHRLLGQERERRRADVAAPGAPAARSASLLHPRAEPVHAGAARHRERAARREAGTTGKSRAAEAAGTAANARAALLVIVVMVVMPVVPAAGLGVVRRLPPAAPVVAVMPVLALVFVVVVSHCSSPLLVCSGPRAG